MRIEYIFSNGSEEQYCELVVDDGDVMLTFSKNDDSYEADGRMDEADLSKLKELLAVIEWNNIQTQYGEINYEHYYHTVLIDLNEAQRYGVTIESTAYNKLHKDLDKLIYHLILMQGKYLQKHGGRCNPKRMPFPYSLTCDKNEEVTKRILQDFIMESRRSPEDITKLEGELRERWKNA